jgi:hypothetical protein
LNLEINLKPVMMQVGDAPRCRGEHLDALEWFKPVSVQIHLQARIKWVGKCPGRPAFSKIGAVGILRVVHWVAWCRLRLYSLIC